MDLGGKMETMAAEKNGLAKVIVDLEAQLKDWESRLEEFEFQAAKEREANRELEEELLLYKKKVVEQHEKGFQKAVRQASFFAKDLDLGLFDPFKNVRDGVLLEEEEIDAVDEAADERQGAMEQEDDVCVQAAFVFTFFLLC